MGRCRVPQFFFFHACACLYVLIEYSIRMATKLTLSVPENTVKKAKSYAQRHGTSVSALFTAAVEALPDDTCKLETALSDWPELRDFVGIADKPRPFDARSERILQKHG